MAGRERGQPEQGDSTGLLPHPPNSHERPRQLSHGKLHIPEASYEKLVKAMINYRDFLMFVSSFHPYCFRSFMQWELL